MGIALPGAGGATRQSMASGALVVGGSLKFDDTAKHYLSQTIGNGTNGFTLSFWMKPCQTGNRDELFDTTASTGFYLYRHTDGSIRINSNSAALFISNGLYRDTSAFYNIVFSYKPVAGSTGYGWLYVNGKLDKSGLFTTQLYAGTAKISSEASNDPANYYLGQWYLVDGLQLGPEYFGYTDPLTNTWRPKKFKAEGTTVNDGTDWSGNYSGSDPGTSFDGTNPSQNGYSHSGSSLTITFPKPLSGRIIVYGGTGGGGADTYTLSDGSSLSTSQAYNSSPYFDALDFGEKSAITSLTCSAGYTLHGVSVDGVMLVDSTTQNLAFGTNGFYLPMDGSSSIGVDKSGVGNDFTPVNFGGSAALDKATGALPILNTLGGTVARPGVLGSDVSSTIAVTVSNATGSNKYYLDSVLNPSLAFIRGGTITFDTGDSSNNSHPFKLSSTNADSSGGTEYTDGVKYYINGSSVSGSDYVSNYSNNGGGTGFRGIKWTIPHNVSTTYYYCTQHNGMGNNGRLNSTTDETKADPHAWKCILAMPMISEHDVSGDMNCTTTNDAITNNSVPFNNNNQSPFYNRSADPDGSQYFSGVDLSSWATDSPWTVEFWWYRTGANTNNHGHFIGGTIGGTNQYGPTYRDASHNDWQFNFKGQSIVITPSPALQTNKWEHHAFTSDGNNITYFRDGVFQTTAGASSMSGTWGSSNEIFRGGAGWNSQYVVGQVCDLRVYAGVEKYTTAGFIPASSNPDIVLDSPSGVATKSKLKKITDGAVAFDGASDNLSVPDHADLDFGTGAFTIECFLYMNSYGSSGSYPSFVSKYTNSLSWILRARNTGKLIWYSSTGGGTNNESSTNPMVLKKWLHIAAVREGTGSNQMKVYVDGKLHLTVTDATDYDDSNALCIGSQNTGNTNVIDGFVSNVRIVKGTAVYTSEFTPPTSALTNVTNTKLLCCQSNTSATEGAVKPGTITANGNAAATNFNPFNTDINTVRGQEGSYATFNPLVLINGGSSVFSDNNFSLRGGSTNGATASTINPTSGKHYFELDIDYVSGQTQGNMGLGIVNQYLYSVGNPSGNSYPSTFCGFFTRTEINSVVNGSESGAQTTEPTVDYTLGLAVDYDAKSMTLYLNGIAGNTVSFSSVTNPLLYFLWGNTDNTMVVNFGQKPFKFPPPNGYEPITSSSARPDTVVARPDKFVKTVLYTGSGAEKTLDVGFQPDFSYFACRSATGYIKYWFDSVRGATKYLATSETQSSAAEGTDAQTLKSFNSNGVTIGTNGQMNENASNTWASWHWKAGGNAGTFNKDDAAYASAAAAGLTAGATAATGSSVGTKQGFSIISYTGPGGTSTSIPHGLEQSPNFVIIKNRDGGDSGSAGGWYSVYHDDFPNKSSIAFLTTAPNDSAWDNHGKITSTTSTVVNVANGDHGSVPDWWTHNSGSDYIMYSWHNVPGLQKFGSYTGNGNADGPFIDLGFRPGIIWLKENGNAGNWTLIDGTRSQINPTANTVWMNRNLAENHTDINPNTGYNNMDMLSNGFKMRSNSTGTNRSGGTYIYCAWAEAPQFNLYGAQSNAR